MRIPRKRTLWHNIVTLPGDASYASFLTSQSLQARLSYACILLLPKSTKYLLGSPYFKNRATLCVVLFLCVGKQHRARIRRFLRLCANPCAPVPRSHCTLASKCKHFRFAVSKYFADLHINNVCFRNIAFSHKIKSPDFRQNPCLWNL